MCHAINKLTNGLHSIKEIEDKGVNIWMKKMTRYNLMLSLSMKTICKHVPLNFKAVIVLARSLCFGLLDEPFDSDLIFKLHQLTNLSMQALLFQFLFVFFKNSLSFER